MSAKGLFWGARQRLGHNGLAGALAYATMRFWAVRRIGRWRARWTRRRNAPRGTTAVFPDTGATERVAALKELGYSEPLTLPEPYTREIRQFAEEAYCTSYTGYGTSGEPVHYRKCERREGERQLGRPIPLAQIRNPASRCDVLRTLEQAPLIHAIAEEYFGYPVRSIETRLYWSFADGPDRPTRVRYGQNVFFHYDLDGFAAHYLFFQFYLTDVDADGGPLELIPRTHGPKPLPLLLGSASLSDEAVDRRYGLSNVVAFHGPPGYGFIMDGYCIHRATVPTGRDRLFLQIRVS